MPPTPPSDNLSATAWDVGREKPNNLDFLRLALATLVILSHAYPLALGEAAARTEELFLRLTRGQITGGELAVDGFFVLSGFLITQSGMNSKSLKDFVTKRLRRIYPGFLVAWLFCVLVVGPVAAGQSPLQPLGEMVRNVLRMVLLWEPSFPNAFATNPFPNALNGSLWTIKYEIACYCLTALLLVVGLLRRRVGVLVLFGLFLAMLCAWYFKVLPLPEKEFQVSYLLLGKPTDWFRLITFYLAGATFYLWRDRIPYSPLLCGASLVLLVVGCFFPPLLSLLLPIWGTYALLFAGFTPVRGLSTIAKHGDVSYGVYLYAFPVQQLLMHYLPTLTPLAQFALALPFTFALAFLSWHGVEKHFLARTRRPERQERTAEK